MRCELHIHHKRSSNGKSEQERRETEKSPSGLNHFVTMYIPSSCHLSLHFKSNWVSLQSLLILLKIQFSALFFPHLQKKEKLNWFCCYIQSELDSQFKIIEGWLTGGVMTGACCNLTHLRQLGKPRLLLRWGYLARFMAWGMFGLLRTTDLLIHYPGHPGCEVAFSWFWFFLRFRLLIKATHY